MADPIDEIRWKALGEIQNDPCSGVLGTLDEAAAAAEVKPGTIRVWMSRGKVKPLFGEPGREIFHIPTVVAVAEAGRSKNVPKDPAANARGPHRRRVLPHAA